MNRSKNQRNSRMAPVLLIAVMFSALSFGAAGAQTGVSVRAQDSWPIEAELAYGFSQAVLRSGSNTEQVPQDIRIMQRIVQTALGEVDAPELPEELKEDPESSGSASGYVIGSDDVRATLFLSSVGNGRYSIRSRNVTGFYMQGYGYLFTVKWQIRTGGNLFVSSGTAEARAAELYVLANEARRAAATGVETEARAAGEAEKALQQEREKLQEEQALWDQWSDQYRDVLAGALRDVVALYGSTLKRATPDESITFIADFGGEETETVTVSARRGDLTGASREENLAAVRLAVGETGVSATLRTELKIMAEIIDSSLHTERGNDTWVVYSGLGLSSGGNSSHQYVPGYGALFRKSARLNIATEVIRQVNPARSSQGVNVQSLRAQIDESTEEQRVAYTEHLAGLKEKTAEILATYGPTLTEMDDDEWVGVFYNVGSAAGLLAGGISNYLVQARMGDIRQAALEADSAAWLYDRLVTNEK